MRTIRTDGGSSAYARRTPSRGAAGAKSPPRMSIPIFITGEEKLIFLLHHYFSLVVEGSFVPISTVPEVRFTCNRADRNIRFFGFIMRAAFVAAAFRMAVFWIWHSMIELKCSIIK